MRHHGDFGACVNLLQSCYELADLSCRTCCKFPELQCKVCRKFAASKNCYLGKPVSTYVTFPYILALHFLKIYFLRFTFYLVLFSYTLLLVSDNIENKRFYLPFYFWILNANSSHLTTKKWIKLLQCFLTLSHKTCLCRNFIINFLSKLCRKLTLRFFSASPYSFPTKSDLTFSRDSFYEDLEWFMKH